MNWVNWFLEGYIYGQTEKQQKAESRLTIKLLRIMCKSRLLRPKDILALAETSYTNFQYLAHYISDHFWFRLSPVPLSHYKPSKVRVNLNVPYIRTYIDNFSHFFPFLTAVDLVAEDLKYLLFSQEQFFLLHVPLTTLHFFGVDQNLGRLPPTLHTLVLRGTFRDLNFTFQNLPQLTSLDVQGRKRGCAGMHSSLVLQDGKYITFFPPSLTRLSIPHNCLNLHVPPTLPPLLISLSITHGHELVQKSRVLNQPLYPSTLHTLSLYFPSLPFILNIPPALTRLKVSSADFNQELSELPRSLTHLTIHTHPRKRSSMKAAGFDKPLEHLPPNLKSLKLLVYQYTHPLDKLPSTLTKFRFYTHTYDLSLDQLPASLTDLRISVHEYTSQIRKWPARLQKVVLHLPFMYDQPLPPFPRTVHSQHLAFAHAQFDCWCLIYEVKRYFQLKVHQHNKVKWNPNSTHKIG